MSSSEYNLNDNNNNDNNHNKNNNESSNSTNKTNNDNTNNKINNDKSNNNSNNIKSNNNDNNKKKLCILFAYSKKGECKIRKFTVSRKTCRSIWKKWIYKYYKYIVIYQSHSNAQYLRGFYMSIVKKGS